MNSEGKGLSEVLRKLPNHLKLKALKILKKEVCDVAEKSDENELIEETKAKRSKKLKSVLVDNISTAEEAIHLEVVSETEDIEKIIQNAASRRISKRQRKRNSTLDDFLTMNDVEDGEIQDGGNGDDSFLDESHQDDSNVLFKRFAAKERKNKSKKEINSGQNINGESAMIDSEDIVDDMIIKVENITNDEVEEMMLSHASSKARHPSYAKKGRGRPKIKQVAGETKQSKRTNGNDGDGDDGDEDYTGNDDADDGSDYDDDSVKRKRKKKSSGRPIQYDEDDVLVMYDGHGGKNTIFQCKTCHKKLSSAYSLKQHTRKHTGNAYVCDLCGSKFMSSTGFKLHMLYHEDDSVSRDIYKCKKCLYAVKSKKLLEEHIKNRHNPNKPRNHICDVCGKGFIVCNQLKRHLLTHAEKDVECPLCPFKTYDQVSLDRHHSNVHSHELTIYECELCGQELRSKGTYLDHIRRHVGHYRKQCDICNKPFANASQLAAHKRSHEQPTVPCEVCGKKLRNKHKLHVHMLVHTGQKDFRCPYCAYATYVSHNLKKHCMNRHAVVYPPDKMKKIKRYDPDDILKVKVLRDSIAINCVKDVQSIKEQTRQEELENEEDVEEIEEEDITMEDIEKSNNVETQKAKKCMTLSEISLRIPATDSVVEVQPGETKQRHHQQHTEPHNSNSSATSVSISDENVLDKRCSISIKPYFIGSSSANDVHLINHEGNEFSSAVDENKIVAKQFITLQKVSTPLQKRIITINIKEHLKKENQQNQGEHEMPPGSAAKSKKSPTAQLITGATDDKSLFCPPHPAIPVFVKLIESGKKSFNAS